MNTRQKLTLGIAAIFMVTLTIVGVTYAYFVTRVEGDNVEESVNVETATVGDIVYKEMQADLLGGTGVTFHNELPGTTKYYYFSVANLGEQQQPFELFLNSSVDRSTVKLNEGTPNESTYTYGEFIHSVTGKDTDEGVVAGCYGQYAKMSAELTDSTEDKATKDLCFSTAETSKYNNFTITLYKLDDSGIESSKETDGVWDFTADSNPFTEITADYTKLTGKEATYENIPTQINYATKTGLVASIDIPGETVYNYVLKVEYTKNANIQNAENLASLKLKVDISA